MKGLLTSITGYIIGFTLLWAFLFGVIFGPALLFDWEEVSENWPYLVIASGLATLCLATYRHGDWHSEYDPDAWDAVITPRVIRKFTFVLSAVSLCFFGLIWLSVG